MSLGQLSDNDCKVLFDKREIKVFKDEKLTIKGIRNKRDSLWDILIQSNKIQNNYIIPPIIALLRKSLKIKYSNHCPNTLHTKKHPYYKISSYLKDLNLLIDYNILDKEISHYKANLILRKKQPKIQLAKYLYTACISPSTSTFIKAIDNNYFII